MNTKTATYISAFNPPTFEDFTNISELLSSYETVLVCPLVKYEDKYYRKATSYKNRMTLCSLFLNDFFPKISDRLILVDIKEEINDERSRTSLSRTLNFLNDKLEHNVEHYLCFEDSIEKDDVLKNSLIQKVQIKVLEENTKEYVRKVLSNLKRKDPEFLSNNIKEFVGLNLALNLSENNPYLITKKTSKLKIS